ncbi:MAG: hypothetical protein KF764_25380 [Labilithrix sp.]|nr:hypothetical protein [Labilithrix sp.]
MARLELSSGARRVVVGVVAASALSWACSDGTIDESAAPPAASDGGVDADDLVDAGADVDLESSDAPGFSGRVTCGDAGPCVTALAANGGGHVCALLADQSVRCWGDNASGQLGAETPVDGGAPHSAAPVEVGGVANASQISVTGNSGGTSCARIDDGSVMCWGSNTVGQLGLSAEAVVTDTAAHPSASAVQGLPFASRVDVAGSFACAVGALGADDEGGSMFCWGNNSVLQLGRGTLPKRVGVAGPVDLRFRRVLAGAGTSRVAFAVRDSGELLSWGGSEWQTPVNANVAPVRDALGRQSSLSPDGDPLEISGLQGVTGVAASAEHACAVAGGRVYCWGVNKTGAVGNSSRQDVLEPYLVTIPGSGLLRNVSVSNTTTCVATLEGGAYCWGDNSHGQLGRGDDEFTFNPTAIAGLKARVVQLATMDRATCALLQDGSVVCWGSNAKGELGIGARDDLSHFKPEKVAF